MSRLKVLVCRNTALVSKTYCINAIPGLNLWHEPNAVITVCGFFVFGYCLVLQFLVSFLVLMEK